MSAPGPFRPLQTPQSSHMGSRRSAMNSEAQKPYRRGLHTCSRLSVVHGSIATGATRTITQFLIECWVRYARASTSLHDFELNYFVVIYLHRTPRHNLDMPGSREPHRSEPNCKNPFFSTTVRCVLTTLWFPPQRSACSGASCQLPWTAGGCRLACRGFRRMVHLRNGVKGLRGYRYPIHL